MVTAPFVPPPYPYDRLDRFKVLGDSFEGGLVDLSIGTPCDPPPPAVIEALASSNAERSSRPGRTEFGPLPTSPATRPSIPSSVDRADY